MMSGALIGVGTVFVPKTDKEIGRIAMIQLAVKYAPPIAWFFTFIYLFSLSAALLFTVGWYVNTFLNKNYKV
ncbi:hypothetical protein [Marinilactibacillus kalidii]|uniref:hypothetical protein n=1 Tax=Marinilactibacillus kalidii TaxID=2820274 RepID=UPI001ABDB03A|nr:hypothetical protein [Marinilactibacillus kalidii]